jgi:hypothetical protein
MVIRDSDHFSLNAGEDGVVVRREMVLVSFIILYICH